MRVGQKQQIWACSAAEAHSQCIPALLLGRGARDDAALLCQRPRLKVRREVANQALHFRLHSQQLGHLHACTVYCSAMHYPICRVTVLDPMNRSWQPD